MLLTGFRPSILARERPQTHPLDRKATGIGWFLYWRVEISYLYYRNISSLYGSIDKASTDLTVQDDRVVRTSVVVEGKRAEH